MKLMNLKLQGSSLVQSTPKAHPYLFSSSIDYFYASYFIILTIWFIPGEKRHFFPTNPYNLKLPVYFILLIQRASTSFTS